MPLTMCSAGKKAVVTGIRATEETKRHLFNLGFNEGTDVTVVNEIDGNLIVKVKDARIAISKSMASHIMVEAC